MAFHFSNKMNGRKMRGENVFSLMSIDPSYRRDDKRSIPPIVGMTKGAVLLK